MRVTAWSYSRYACYSTCPLQYKLRHIDKIPEPPAPALERGDRVHKQIAAYLTDKGALPTEAESFTRLMGELKTLPDKIVEQQWGFTKEWKPTGWFGKETWLRSVLDVAVLYEDLTGEVIDHKTGRRYGSNDEQMELFALSFMSKYKLATHVTTRLWYVDSGDEELAEFHSKDKTKLQEKWDRKVQPLFNDTVFAPRPNDKCRFCAFSRSKQGNCRFG